MKTNKQRFRIIAGFLIPAALFVPTVRGEETVAWADLPKRLGNHENRQCRVVTKDGAAHVGDQLAFGPTDVKLYPSGLSIPREAVKEVRLHRYGPLGDAIRRPGGVVLQMDCGGFPCSLTAVLLLPLTIPVALGVTAAAAPVVLPIEGVKRLLPDKVIKVAP